MLSTAAVAGLSLAGLFAADRLTLFPGALRLLAAAGLVFGGVVLLYVRVIAVLLRPPGPSEAARALERRYAQLGDFALSAAELALAKGSKSSAPSEHFVAMTVDEAARRAAGTNPSAAAPAAALGRPAALAALAAAFWTAAAIFFPGDAATFLRRLSDPLGAWAYATKTTIVAVEAPGVLPRGAIFEATAVAEGVLPEEAIFHIRGAGGANRVYARGDAGRYSIALGEVRESFSFFVEAGDARTDESAVKVVELPAVAALGAEVTYPPYTGVGAVTVSGGDIKAPRGSRVRVAAQFNKPVEQAGIVFGDGGKATGAVDGEGLSASFEFTLGAAQTYRIELADEYGFANADSPEYALEAQADAAPVVALVRPARDLTAVADAALPVEVKAADDYGVRDVRLAYRIRRGGKEKARGAISLVVGESAKSREVSYRWELSGLGLAAGDELTYLAEAEDNLPDAPQTGVSKTQSVRVVTVAEKILEIEQLNRQIQALVQNADRKQAQARAAFARAAGMEAAQ